VTQATVPNYYHLQLYCTDGARIQLPKLAAFTSGTIDAYADGDGSVIDLSGWPAVFRNTSSVVGYLEARNGASILMPNVTTMQGIVLTHSCPVNVPRTLI
jgi:hypothetical protein